MGNSTISMAIFNSKLLVYQRVKYGWVWVKTLVPFYGTLKNAVLSRCLSYIIPPNMGIIGLTHPQEWFVYNNNNDTYLMIMMYNDTDTMGMNRL